MFERYTESARRLLFFARYEACELGASSIEAEHLLLGLTRQNKGITGEILALASLSPRNIRLEVERRVSRGAKISTSVEVPFTAATTRILGFAAEEANRFRHDYIGTEHLLLGLLREPDSLAATILTEMGLRLEETRNALVRLLGEAAGHSHSPAGVLEEVERIRTLVQQLANAAPYSDEAWVIVEQINGALDGLKPGR